MQTPEKRYSAVSAISSLHSGDNESESSFCVSPISEASEYPHHSRKTSQESRTSPISPEPLPKLEDASSQPLPPSPPRTEQKVLPSVPKPERPVSTRWDNFSGEPTSKTNGKTGQVNPQNTSFHKSSGSTASNILHWGREQLQPKKKFAQARNRISSFSKIEPSAPKENKGRYSPPAAPWVDQPTGNVSGRNSPFDSNEYLGFVPTTVTTISSAGRGRDIERPYSRTRNERSSDARKDLDLDRGRKEKPSVRFGSTTFLPDIEIEPSLADSSPEQTEQDLQELAPAEAQEDAPEELPTLPEESSSQLSRADSPESDPALTSTDDLTSIMSRKRPVPNANLLPTSRKPIRKPTPSETTSGPKAPAQQKETEKPKDPQSRIEILEARRDELSKRRLSLETLIDELTRAIQPGPGALSYDTAAKAEVKKTLQVMENDVAEIKREEHELGLKISRAWKRWDEQENNGDGSNLWIKRVTS